MERLSQFKENMDPKTIIELKLDFWIATTELVLPYGSKTLLWYHNVKDGTDHLIEESPHKRVSIQCAGPGIEERAT